MSVFRKAERRKAKLRLAITGPAGSGKTYGALLVAQGLGGRIAMIDTENGSGDLYSAICDYDILTINAPYDIRKYIKAIHDAESEGYDVLIIDSLSHCWIGEGGLLDMKESVVASGKFNSYSAWSKVTPFQNKLIDTMLSSRCHIIATMHSRTDYIQVVNERGKSEIRKVGLAPVQRDGMDYEFGVVFDLNTEHSVTVSKDRTSLFDGQSFTLSADTGAKLLEWLNSGADVPVPAPDLSSEKRRLYDAYLKLFADDPQNAQALAQEAMMNIVKGKSSKDWTVEDLKNLEADIHNRTNPENNDLPQAVNF